MAPVPDPDVVIDTPDSVPAAEVELKKSNLIAMRLGTSIKLLQTLELQSGWLGPYKADRQQVNKGHEKRFATVMILSNTG